MFVEHRVQLVVEVLRALQVVPERLLDDERRNVPGGSSASPTSPSSLAIVANPVGTVAR